MAVFWVFLILILCYSGYSQADEITFNGQTSVWTAFNDEDLTGIRYIPELNISYPLTGERGIDAFVSLNLYTWGEFDSSATFEDNADLKLYRSWLRYSSSQFETRLGLQKINFGPAKIFRTLRWFDQLDIRDPLKLTEGVYAVLGRYYFLNNANIWLWGLYGNDNLKGLEAFETDEHKMEWGGRCQYPVPKGEAAFSFNRRYIDIEDWNNEMSEPMTDGLENRFAIDGNWDIGIGLWFETSVEEIKINSNQQEWRKCLTIGSDYTFESGVHLLCEHFVQSTGSEIDQSDEKYDISALSLDYRFNIIDSINTIGYYDWDKEKSYYYVGWLRTYDNWQLNLSAFSNRDDDTSILSGEGVQCMLIYNH